VGEIFAEIGVAFAARRGGELDVAERHLTALLRAAGPEGEGQRPALHKAMVLNELGYLAAQRGQAAEARQLHLRAMGAAQTLGAPRDVATTLEGLAGAAGLAGDHETSARLLGAADTARRLASVPAAPSERREIDRITAAARAALGGDIFDVAYLDGAARTPSDVMASFAS
jgi:hypothetical protein